MIHDDIEVTPQCATNLRLESNLRSPLELPADEGRKCIRSTSSQDMLHPLLVSPISRSSRLFWVLSDGIFF